MAENANLEALMDLAIYGFVLETVAVMRLELEVLRRRSSALGDQMERAMTSVPLNVSEGAYAQGKNKRARYYTALGSARETLACVETGVALGYLPGVREEVRVRMNRILGTLTRLAR